MFFKRWWLSKFSSLFRTTLVFPVDSRNLRNEKPIMFPCKYYANGELSISYRRLLPESIENKIQKLPTSRMNVWIAFSKMSSQNRLELHSVWFFVICWGISPPIVGLISHGCFPYHSPISKDSGLGVGIAVWGGWRSHYLGGLVPGVSRRLHGQVRTNLGLRRWKPAWWVSSIDLTRPRENTTTACSGSWVGRREEGSWPLQRRLPNLEPMCFLWTNRKGFCPKTSTPVKSWNCWKIPFGMASLC